MPCILMQRKYTYINRLCQLVNSNKGISSIFQKGIDTHLKESNVFQDDVLLVDGWDV